MKKISSVVFVSALILLTSAGRSEASSITCPTTGTIDRQATVSSAINCVTVGQVTGTPKASDVTTAFGSTWYAVGTLAGTTGTNGWLTLGLTGGSWGSLPVSGTWAIDPALWQLYPEAVLTFHVGNGSGNPDWFLFELQPNATSGTFNIVKLQGNGGGFSNITLWTNGLIGPTAVPEPASLFLLGTGLAGLAVHLRKRHARRNARP